LTTFDAKLIRRDLQFVPIPLTFQFPETGPATVHERNVLIVDSIKLKTLRASFLFAEAN